MNPEAKREAELERLRKEHRALDEQLLTLERRRVLTTAEDDEIKRLKRAKLKKKEEIAAIAGR